MRGLAVNTGSSSVKLRLLGGDDELLGEAEAEAAGTDVDADALGRAAAATVSSVGMSPAQPRTTSGTSCGRSLPAQSQMPRPRVQWRIASSIER